VQSPLVGTRADSGQRADCGRVPSAALIMDNSCALQARQRAGEIADGVAFLFSPGDRSTAPGRPATRGGAGSACTHGAARPRTRTTGEMGGSCAADAPAPRTEGGCRARTTIHGERLALLAARLDSMVGDCRAARLACSLQLDGELTVHERERLAQHLSCCGSCRSFACELEAISSWLRVGRQKEMADVDSS
jgi:hypothetical protein